MVEDAIKKRQREAEERKKRILAAFDVASKASPAGAPKDVDFEVANTIDSKWCQRTCHTNSQLTETLVHSHRVRKQEDPDKWRDLPNVGWCANREEK